MVRGGHQGDLFENQLLKCISIIVLTARLPFGMKFSHIHTCAHGIVDAVACLASTTSIHPEPILHF